MREEIIVSGRMNPGIDPYLHVWSWEIPLYLFLGGLAAGLLIYAMYYFLQKKENEYPTIVRFMPMFVPVLLVVGLLALFLDLRHKLFFWQLYTTIRFESPMSWGAWTLMAVTPFSIFWIALQLKKLYPVLKTDKWFLKPLDWFIVQKSEGEVKWEWRYKFLIGFEKFLNRYIREFATILLVFSVILGIYTGILLSAFNARPLWNTSILGPLFLVSGMSTAAALIMLITKNKAERKLMSKIDLIMIGIELFILTHMFMGFFASTQVQIDAARMFMGGPYTAVFWVFVVFLGLVIPAILEILELRGYHIPVMIPALLVLFGGLMLRFVMVFAGQASRYLY